MERKELYVGAFWMLAAGCVTFWGEDPGTGKIAFLLGYLLIVLAMAQKEGE